ncbi:MAG: isoprenylcysteine carboxyl methyltransferase family protein [Nocardioidaceae bacterium]|nr:isoprenylcysteine carboxyl methyltransferase family protein [Nocardioidaceae bacterium]
MIAYVVLVALVGLERLAELVVSMRNAAWSFARGGLEFGQAHYPLMVVLHSALLGGCVIEVLLADRPFVAALGWPMLVVVLLSQALRWWCIFTLGPQWNTRVIVVPGLPLVRHGPFRWLRHPNYLAVVAEGAALPLIHTAWVTAIAFTLLNAVLLRVRISCEESALAQLTDGASTVGQQVR